MSLVPIQLSCPHCPSSLRTFSEHGLRVHVGRMHRDVRRVCTDARVSPTRSSNPTSRVTQTTAPGRPSLEGLAHLKGGVPVLRHIPKGARNQAAGGLCDVINSCLSNNGINEWSELFCFAYSALRVPSKEWPGNMTTKVKANISSSRSWCAEELTGGRACSGSRAIERIIETKVFDGDLRGAARLLMSDDSFARRDGDTLAALKAKHPEPSRPLSFPSDPDLSFPAVSVTVKDVVKALSSFYVGSAGGLDGIRPTHLKELTSVSAGDNGRRLLECITRLVNFLLSGQLNPLVCPYLYGASLFALVKRDGGIRPIAVGSIFRRLAAKLACRAVRENMSGYLQPHQLGFGTRSGCEAAIHATRAFVMDPANEGSILLKLDIRNAFNTLERDVILREVKENVPSLFPFLHQVYRLPSNLFFDNNQISSQVGAQQGDPLGPLLFSLAIHKVITELKSPFNVWYLDDGTIGGRPEDVLQDLEYLIPRFKDLGLEVNTSKCEFFPCSVGINIHSSRLSAVLPGLRELSSLDFTLLGSPVVLDAVPGAIASRMKLLLATHERLKGLSAHVAIVLLRACFALPKINYLLRTTPTWLCPEEVLLFDKALKSIVESVLNVSMDDNQWCQASLPIRCGGLGVRSMKDVGLPAFLASANGVASLVTVLLGSHGGVANIPFLSDAVSAWLALSPSVDLPGASHVQREWDDVGVKRTQGALLENSSGAGMARLRAVSRPESGAWLRALPSPNLGTLLDDDSLRVAVALRLGCNVCERHVCTCGSVVEADGHHALSCRRCSGRFPRHHALNDVVRRALISANIPCLLEPPGLCRSDGKRPDGMTLVPWKNGKCLIWDATCVSTVAASHLSRTVRSPSAAAEDACYKKRQKYAALEQHYHFVTVAVETMGSWAAETLGFVGELGRRLSEINGDSRSCSFLVQRLAIAIQRGNAASIMGTFPPDAIGHGLI